MSRAIAPRVEHYVSPSEWGAGANGQPRKMFNYGDGLVAVLVSGRSGGETREVYRFRYCINSKSSTLHIGAGGPAHFEGARRHADVVNEEVKANRAKKSSLEERTKRIGKEQKSRKKERSDSGFRNRDDLIRFVAHLQKQVFSSQVSLLTILHISTLLDLWQLLNMKYEDIGWFGNSMHISICLDRRNKNAKNKFALPNSSKNCFSSFLSQKMDMKPHEYVFCDLKEKPMESLHDLIGMEIRKAGIIYPVSFDSLRNQFINEFSEHGLIEKTVLEKFIGFRHHLPHMSLIKDGNFYICSKEYGRSTQAVIHSILEIWDRNLFPNDVR